MKNIKRRMTPQPLKIRADIELTCFKYDGVLHIQARCASILGFRLRVLGCSPFLHGLPCAASRRHLEAVCGALKVRTCCSRALDLV